MRRNRIAEQWNDFSAAVLTDPKISQTQRIEMRRAFYAGALAVFHSLAVDMSSSGSDTVTQADEQMLLDLSQEFKDYERDLRNGRA